MSNYTCLVCKKGIKGSVTRPRKYCSMKCRNIGYKFRPDVLECMWCGDLVTQNRARRKKYCSSVCRQEYAQWKGMNNGRKYCLCCDKVFHIYGKGKAKSIEQKYCSHKCYIAHRFNKKIVKDYRYYR